MCQHVSNRLLKAVFVLSSCILFLAAGCGAKPRSRFTKEQLAHIRFPQRSALPQSSGGFVLAVGDTTLNANESVLQLLEHFRPIAQSTDPNQFKEQAREQVEQVITTKILNILLYREARKHADEATEEVVERLAEAELEKFFVRFGSDMARASETLRQMGKDRQSYKEYLKMTILIHSYTMSQVPSNIPITYGEFLDYYNQMKDELFVRPATIKFRLLDIKVDALQASDPNQDPQQLAKDLANELLGRLREGEDFDKLGEEYSGVVFRDHSDGVRPQSLGKDYAILAAKAERMKPGETRAVLSETGERIFVIKLDGKQSKGYKPLEQVQRQVEKKIIADRRQKAVAELEAKLLQQVPISERDAFVDFCLMKIYQMSNPQRAEGSRPATTD